MSHYTHRALRAAVAAAGMAALGMSLVGTAAAASPNTDESTDGNHALDNQSPQTPSLTDADGNGTPGISNELLTFEVPKVETASYRTAWNMPVSHHHEDADDENNDDEDNVCHGTNGSWDLPFHNAYQHPCQSHGNSFQEGPVQYFGVPAANRVNADSPSHSLYSHDASQGHVNQTGGPATAASLLGLAKSPAPSGGLTQMNGYQLGTTQL